jgi:hypothetical protein
MSVDGFEIVGAEEFRRLVDDLRSKIKERFNLVDALEEASKVAEALASRKYKAEALETPEDLPPIYRVEIEKAVIYIIVYPPKYDLLAGEASKAALYILSESPYAERDSGKYKVLIFYTRHGKLGPAAYLYLGMLIEEYGIGILFVNGSVEEVLSIIETLEKEGKYEPPEEDFLPIK